MLLEQIFERLKNPKQIAPQHSYFHHMKDIMQNKGIIGVFDGAVANAIRTVARHLWRNPLALGGKTLCEAVLPEETKKHHPTLTHNLGIMTMAALDPLFLTPLERIKTIQQTQPGKSTAFYSLARSLSWTELYRGSGVLSARQMQFFGISIGTQEATKQLLGKEELSWGEKLGSAFLSATSYVAVSNPLDVMKTRIQQYGSTETASDVGKEMCLLYQKHGARIVVRGMFVGGVMRVATNAVSTMASLAILDMTLTEPSSRIMDVASIAPLEPSLQKISHGKGG